MAKHQLGPNNGHKLTKEEMARGGRNGKPGPSIKKRLEKFLDAAIPDKLLKELKNHKIVVGDKMIPLPMVPHAKNMADAIALLMLKSALLREPWALQFITNQIDGAPKTSGSLDVKGLSLADVLANDKTAAGVLEKYALDDRNQKPREQT